ncbi:Uncharacterised protein [Klebsiella pneumoniae]|nr:Uncharacterised protein [Klebsiella pneumoniae]
MRMNVIIDVWKGVFGRLDVQVSIWPISSGNMQMKVIII